MLLSSPVPRQAKKDQDSLLKAPVRLQRPATQEAEPEVSAESPTDHGQRVSTPTEAVPEVRGRARVVIIEGHAVRGDSSHSRLLLDPCEL